MSELAAQSAIETEFMTNWPHTQVARENTDFEPQTLTEYVRLSVLPASGRQASLGLDPLYRYRGIVCIQIFTRSGDGWGRAVELAGLVSPIFRSKRLGDIQFGVPSPTKLGPRDGWYQVNVDTPYYREEY